VIAKKLDDFEPEYDWTARTAETQASLYIFQLVSWLTTVVDSLDIEDRFKAAAYRNAMIHVSNLFMVSILLPTRRVLHTCGEHPNGHD
jgi:hypothetical protein